ncbi:hypothetical protein SAMN00777080_2025 [Aquiflexum balticum DSM 16537]|uniref:C-terminal domain of CHU protein family protein n=2 Tax=Aquiflexum TaxID=280472 RepID=A0A1W2H3D8_9BACT|nr:hypothetical protein SAMN00777080_2025 [Aquiflexum balticum DSM 16537]
MGNYGHFLGLKGMKCLFICVLIFLSGSGFGKNIENNNPNDHTFYGLNSTPELTGPDNLCIIFGSAIADFSGGGNPATDVYNWVITNSSGQEHFSRNGGATFQNISVQFSEFGNYNISLNVRRGNDIIYTGSKTLSVIQGPELVLKPDYLLCGSEPAIITAINPNTPNIGSYIFEWRNPAGVLVGDQNELTVHEEGQYFITLYLSNSSGGTDCQINGNTYVGPPRDFSLLISNDQICQGNSINISVDTPLIGEWLIQKVGVSPLNSVGTAYELTLDSETDLDGPGNYRVVFRNQDDQYPNCVSERDIYFSIHERVEFNISDVFPAGDCDSPNGSFRFNADSPIELLRIPELTFSANNLAQGESVLFENLYPGIYTIETQLDGCSRNEVIVVPNSSPVPEMLFTVTEFEESCTPVGKMDGSIRVEFLNGPFTGQYRIVEANAALSLSGAISNASFFEVDLPGGQYAIEIISQTGCKLPQESFIDIAIKEFVSFSIPEVVNVCGSMDFVPATEENLLFILTYPSGEQVSKEAGQSFILDVPGIYQVLGRSTEIEPALCPRSQQFEVVLINQPNFEPVLESEDCFGNKLYRAELFGTDPSNLSIRWYDRNFEIVGRGVQWYPTGYGEFYLNVQPRGSALCESNPKLFEVTQPVFEVDVELTSGLICPGGLLTTVVLESDFEEVDRIEWIYIDLNGVQSTLTQFANEKQIDVGLVGTYEAVVYNRIGCEIGRDLILVLESESQERPEVRASYSICSESGYGEIVDPGSFVSYEWFFEGEFISDSPTLKLNRGGQYSLFVTNQDGCVFEASFSTFEDCTFQFVFPNAMVLNDPDKIFEIIVNDAVDFAQLWIHNRQGELFYFCEGKDVQSRLAFCQWDGMKNGKYIPVGNYTMTLWIRSSRFGLEKKISQNLTVLK